MTADSPSAGTVHDANPEPSYTVTLRAVADDGAPAVIRLRRFLKAALRQYGLRCIGCEVTTERTADRAEKRAKE